MAAGERAVSGSTVYLDNNATTQVAPEVLEAMMPYLTDEYFNPSSMYDAAKRPSAALAHAREVVAQHLGQVKPSEVLFTSCATESNNAAIFGVARANPTRRHIITTAVEHPAVLVVAQELQRQGFEVTFLGVDTKGSVDIAEYVRALRPDTLLVSVMFANNETGVVYPIAELARLAKETDPNIIVHTDATQAVGKLPMELSGALANVDLLSFSGHKLHAPKGVGALFVRQGTPCRPFLLGGHQEAGRRGGTENVAFIVGLARALDLLQAHHDRDDRRIRSLRDKLEQALEEQIPYLQVNGKGAERLSNTSNVSFHFIEGEGILYQLSALGICASSGSACTSGSLEPSHVLRAMKIPFTAVHGSLRLSLSRYTTQAEVERTIEVLPEVIANLRRLSPYWDAARNQPRQEAMAMMSQVEAPPA